jgi:predicted metalloenzyme YecM
MVQGESHLHGWQLDWSRCATVQLEGHASVALVTPASHHESLACPCVCCSHTEATVKGSPFPTFM